MNKIDHQTLGSIYVPPKPRMFELVNPQNLLQNALRKIASDHQAQALFEGFSGQRKVTLRSVEDAACNHCFDDHPEAFGLDEQEGHTIRAMFIEASVRETPGFRESMEMLIGFTQALLAEENKCIF